MKKSTKKASPGTVSHQNWAVERAVPALQTRGEGKATKSPLPPPASPQQPVQICREEKWGISERERKNNPTVTGWKWRGSSKLRLEETGQKITEVQVRLGKTSEIIQSNL